VWMRLSLVSLFLGLILTTVASAQFKQKTDALPGNVELGKKETQSYRAGMEVTAVGGACLGLKGYVPMPVNWPEQKVTIAKEEIPSAARISYQKAQGGVRLMVIHIPRLSGGQKATIAVTMEIERRVQLPPEKTDHLKFPESRDLSRDTRYYLGPSPYIESRNGKIKKLAASIPDKEATAWEQVEQIYDWVREEVTYKKGPLKGAVAALRDKEGDCEELASLFIAILRAKGIPARTVWVPGHCYAEFYLVDEDGKGQWFPCQAAGSRSFGGISEFRPILQKGDNFRLPDNPRERVRYLPERVTGAASAGKPKVRFIKESL
jgi:Transglutaminase-like superfamily